MIKHYFFAFLCLIGTSILMAQTDYPGNGSTGFGDVIGSSNLNVNDDGTTITFTLTRGPGEFFDALVLYIDTGASGRTVIDSNVNDFNDPLRRAISNANDQGNETIINFPAGFEASYAIAVDTNFGGLWQIPATGIVDNANPLPFVTAANSTLMASSDLSFTFDVDWSELGYGAAGSFDFVGLYLNAGNAFSSNEGYGDGLPPGDFNNNPGGGTITYTAGRTYTSTTLSINGMGPETADIKYFNNIIQISGINDSADINIYDMLGRRVSNLNSVQLSGQTNIPVELPKGQVYIVQVRSDNMNKTFKILSQ